MAAYLARRIMEGFLNYNAVIERYPEHKAIIDEILFNEGYFVYEDGTVTKGN